MKMHDLLLSLLFVLTLIAGCSTDGDTPQTSGDNDDTSVSVTAGDLQTEAQTIERSLGRVAEPVYAVAKYDADRDPKKDLAATIRQASSGGKRILLEVGGNW